MIGNDHIGRNWQFELQTTKCFQGLVYSLMAVLINSILKSYKVSLGKQATSQRKCIRNLKSEIHL